MSRRRAVNDQAGSRATMMDASLAGTASRAAACVVLVRADVDVARCAPHAVSTAGLRLVLPDPVPPSSAGPVGGATGGRPRLPPVLACHVLSLAFLARFGGEPRPS